MAIAGDIIQVTFVQEMKGKSMTNTFHFQIDDVGGDPALVVALIQIGTLYADAVKTFLSDSWALTCLVMENITNPEGKTIVRLSVLGDQAINSHGPDTVLRMNQYAADDPAFTKVIRGAWNQSGVITSFSTRGRWNTIGEFQTLIDFLSITQAIDVGSWIIQPHLQWQDLPGPPPTYFYNAITDVQPSGRVFKLSSRKSNLCQTF